MNSVIYYSMEKKIPTLRTLLRAYTNAVLAYIDFIALVVSII